MTISVTKAQFIADYPEFASVTQALFDARSALALEMIPESVWGATRGTLAAKLLIAHLMCISPNGEPARIKVDGSPSTLYLEEWMRLRAGLGPHMMLV